MKAKLKHLYRQLFEPRALVLMYHRVAEPSTNVWETAVSTAHFEQHLQWLKENRNVVPLPQLVQEVKSKTLRKKQIAITFDDGYQDNFLVAKPLLEKYRLPATFFIPNYNIDTANKFWWDELEQIFLLSDSLPASFSCRVEDAFIEHEIAEEALLTTQLKEIHQAWSALVSPPPTKRCALYYKIWELFRALPYTSQEKNLQIIKNWAGLTPASNLHDKSMTLQQLQELNKSRLFHIGVHTVTHPALAHCDPAAQESEMTENKRFLEEVCKKEMNMIAYPYGNYNEFTLEIASKIGFSAAFTTEEQLVTRHSQNFRFGRFQVKNIPLPAFGEQLKQWEKQI